MQAEMFIGIIPLNDSNNVKFLFPICAKYHEKDRFHRNSKISLKIIFNKGRRILTRSRNPLAMYILLVHLHPD